MNNSFGRIPWLGVLALVTMLPGCDSVDPPAFRMNMVEAVSYETAPEYQQEIADVLAALFGTPDEPFALPATGLDQVMLNRSAGPAWSDEAGYNYGLYRKHCVHCHGITGDGRGPTAMFLNPYPRDYRPGVYKFKSTYNPAKPTDDDLHRVLINGVPGTAMPSFSLLPGSEVESLVEYVKYLSYRGEMETKLIQYVFDELGVMEKLDDEGNEIIDANGDPVMERIPFDPTNDPDQREAVMDLLAEVVDAWDGANEMIIAPTEDSIPAEERTPEEVLASIEKGRSLFFDKDKGNCYSCHGPTGLGDGQQDDYNNWQKAHKKFLDETAKLAEKDELDDLEASLLDDREEVAESLYPLRNAIPRNLRQGVYRGGRRKLDIFRRIYAGIAGTPMPGGGPSAPGAKAGALTEEEMWNIVDYVYSLPYEPASQPQVVTPKYTQSITN